MDLPASGFIFILTDFYSFVCAMISLTKALSVDT